MKTPLLVSAFLALAGPALAHTGGAATGFVHGVLHPLLGADHLLAMLAVGLWSGFVLPARLWAGAATFLAAMTLGAGLAWAGLVLPGVEAMIVLSVVVFGAAVLLGGPGQGAALRRGSLAAIGLFAAAHGFAHATEATGAVALYLAGFLGMTALLHGLGLLVARVLLGHGAGRMAQRGLGGGIAGAGLWMMAA
jgi:urease accessory protein